MQYFSFLVINGPNLGHLGTRQPDIYGSRGMDALPGMITDLLGSEAAERITLDIYQNNSEGALIDRMELAREEGMHGIVLNAGAYTHTSLALADCLAWIGVPCVEVHLSNVLARGERLRSKSYIGKQAIGVIAGFGMMSYALAVQALVQHLKG